MLLKYSAYNFLVFNKNYTVKIIGLYHAQKCKNILHSGKKVFLQLDS